MIKNWYLLPLISELLNCLSLAKKFTQLDLISTYHQIRIRKGDGWKTVFKTWYGYLKYQVMFFGFSNAPASFQGYINIILPKKLKVYIIVYLDDILVYTIDTSQGYLNAVWWVLDFLKKNELFANWKKCWFHQNEFCFL